MSTQWDAYLTEYVGTPYTTERISGVGGPGCHVVRGSRGEAILKYEIPEREEYFYRVVAPRLSREGLASASLLASGTSPTWILLERLPSTLPTDRWQGDRDVMRYLARWHQLSDHLVPDLRVGYDYAWDGHAFEELTGWVGTDTLSRLESIVDERHDAFLDLFEPITWIHGDPNPTNWLLTASGDVTLVDWSRFGKANPALDLAVSIPGMPTWDLILSQAKKYLVFNPAIKKSAEALAQTTALGKLWTFMDFLLMGKRGELSIEGNQGINMLSLRLDPWLRALF